MKDKIFQLLKQEYKSLGLGDEVLQAHAEMLDKMGLVTDDNIETVVASQKSFLESLQKDNDRRVTDAKKKFEEAQKAKEDAERKAAEEEAKKKAEAEKARDLMENGDKKWMVQVALAANQANADAVVSKLRAKGYKVTTSSTSKGIRIMVGPAKDRDVADATRKKISSDESLNMKSAWVIDWVPLDQR